MSEENIHVDTLVTEDMSKKDLFDYAKYLEYKKEELLNINSYLFDQLQQKENIIKEVREKINKAINEGYDYHEKDNLLFESLEILDKAGDEK